MGTYESTCLTAENLTAETYEFTDEVLFNAFNATPLLCAIDVGKNVTEEFELISIWALFEPVLLEHVVNITNCISAGDEAAVQVCTRREQLASRDTYILFLAAVNEVRILNIEKEMRRKMYLCFRDFCRLAKKLKRKLFNYFYPNAV